MAIVVGPTRWNIFLKDPYIATARFCPLGTTLSDGSSLICKNGSGVAFFVAPSASQVGRSWTSRNDAVTTAQACTGRTGWFVPSCSQLISGYCCRSFWNSFSPSVYWSSTEGTVNDAWSVYFFNALVFTGLKTRVYCVRAFRCVTY